MHLDHKHWSDFLDVQDANSRVSQQCRIRNDINGRRFETGRYTSIEIVGLCFSKLVRIRMLTETPRAQLASVFVFLILLITFLSIRLITFQATFQSAFPARLDNEAITHTIIEGRSPNVTLVSRTRRVDLDLLS